MNFNLGTDVAQWVIVVKVIIVLLSLFWAGVSAYKLFKVLNSSEPETSEGKILKSSRIKSHSVVLVFKSLLSIVLILFLFVFFGSGEIVTPMPIEEEGYYKHIQEQEGLPPDSVLQKEAEENRPYELKRQDDPNFEAEKEKADKYLEEALEKAKEYEDK